MSNGTLSCVTDSDPTAADDTSKGFTAGSTWTNSATKEVFECVDAALSDATWRPLSQPVTSTPSSIPQVPSHVVAEAVSQAAKPPLDTVTGTFRANGNYRVTVDDVSNGMLRSIQDSGHEAGAETPPSVRKDGEMADNLGVAAPVLPVVTTVDRCAPNSYWGENDNDDMIADGFQHVLRGQTDINNNIGATGQRGLMGQRITDGLVTAGTDAVLHGQAGINENVGSTGQRLLVGQNHINENVGATGQRIIAGQRITDAELGAGFQNTSNGQRHTDGLVTSGVNHLSGEHMELAEGQRFTDRAVQDGTQAGLTGQRFTDARIADGVQGLSRQINQDAMFLDAEANRNAQYLGNQVARGTEQLLAGQDATDRNVDANGRWLNDGQRHTDDTVNGNARWLDRNIDDVDRDVNRGFRETERGQRLTDDVVNGNARWLDRGHRDIQQQLGATERHLDREIDDVDDNVSDSARWLHTGQDNNARWLHSGQDANAWRLAQQQGADTRFLRSGQEADTRYLDGNIDGARRETAHGFGHTNEHVANSERRVRGYVNHVGEELAESVGQLDKDLCDAERRIENHVDDGRRENAHNFGRTNEHLANTERRLTNQGDDSERRLHGNIDGAERRIEGTVRHGDEHLAAEIGGFSRRTASDFRDTERRLDNRIDASERRVESVVRHNLEEISEQLGDHDRRASERLAEIACEVGREGDKTRGLVEKTDLETRLYLRDREDRTHDLVRALADRNLVEMQNFERRSRDDESATRALIRHEVEERHERDFALSVARETRLQNRVDLLEALECRDRRDWDRDRHHRGGINFNPNINVHIDDVMDDRNFQAQAQRQRQFDPNVRLRNVGNTSAVGGFRGDDPGMTV